MVSEEKSKVIKRLMILVQTNTNELYQVITKTDVLDELVELIKKSNEGQFLVFPQEIKSLELVSIGDLELVKPNESHLDTKKADSLPEQTINSIKTYSET